MINSLKNYLCGGAAAFAIMSHGSLAYGQTAANADPVEDEIITVGTQIQGAKISGILPVTRLDVDDIDALGVVSGEDLFRALPSQGATGFSDDNETGGINGVRGDVASINLRSLGTGNTLVLLNGRRLVLHPGTKAENLVPVVTPNLNALPTGGVRRVEVLRDGASAIYGADAVGGVINTVLRDKYDGLQLTLRYGDYEGIDADSLDIDAFGGFDLEGGKTQITLFGSYLRRGGYLATEREYSRKDDLRPLVAGTAFDDDTNFDNRSTNSAWGQFDTTRRVRQNGTSLTSAAGRFHIQPNNQPDDFSGCLADLGGGVCIDDSTLDRDLRHNNQLESQIASDLDRYNGFMFLNRDMDNGNELYGELSVYYSETDKIREANTPLSSTPITISETAFYNPFGAVLLPDGSLNANRLVGIDAPAGGLTIEVGGANGRYRLLDAGPRQLEVENLSMRGLIGMRGDWGNWDWDTAALYSFADTSDITKNRVSSTLFQRQLNLSTAAAYNPFNGGDPMDPSAGDATPNPQSSIAPFLIDVSRDSKTELYLADFKISRNDIYVLPAGDVGAAFGVEVRHENYTDDRDDRLDGTVFFTDAVTGEVFDSDVMGSSATPDSKGDRTTFSAFGEFYVPIVSPEMNIPLVHRIDMQLAGRYENASDFGDVFAPKIALSYYPAPWLQVRTAYSEGFRAPNLDQVNAEGIQRSNTRDDYIRCQAQINQGQDVSLSDCGQSQGILSIRSGSSELEPETNETFTVGFVFEPDFLIPGLTFTADYYNIVQDNVVGIAGDDLQIVLDFVRRLNGETNPAVVRAAADADDIAFFAGSGITPAGTITGVADPYLNLDRRTSEGIDFGIYYELDDTPFGNFDFNLDATLLKTFNQDASSVVQEIRQEARANDIPLTGQGSLLEQDGFPKWRGVGRVTWRKDNWGAGGSVSYTGGFDDVGAIQDDTDEFFRVKPWTIANAYVQYTFKDVDAFRNMENLRVRIGANNITNEEPPLADETYGYYSEYHNSRGRFVYGQLQATF